MDRDVREAAERIAVDGALVAVERFGDGLINDSYQLTFERDGRTTRCLLQRINARVFPRPAHVMENVARVTAHVARKLREAPGGRAAERCGLALVPARDGQPFHVDERGAYWRAYGYVEGSFAPLTVRTADQARLAAEAFGEFQRLLADLPPPRLHETIADFHNTPARFAALERAIAADPRGRVAAVRGEIDFALAHRGLAPILIELERCGAIPERIVHNDAKISNVLFDEATDRPLCVVDLDTVMPGLGLYDFGDMVRTMTCLAAEDETDLTRVEVDPALLEAVTSGYLSGAGPLLNAAERDHLLTAGKLILLEQGVRYLTDYLDGDRYYRISRPAHNLDRSRTQFKLFDSLEALGGSATPA